MSKDIVAHNPKVLAVIGAYGRRATLEDWKTGKDFKILKGPYCSIRDVPRMKADGYDAVVLLCMNEPCVVISL